MNITSYWKDDHNLFIASNFKLLVTFNNRNFEHTFINRNFDIMKRKLHILPLEAPKNITGLPIITSCHRHTSHKALSKLMGNFL
jgi:hypothetical protein